MVEEVLPIVPLSRPFFGPTHNTLLLIRSHLTWKVTIYHFRDKALKSGSTTNSEKRSYVNFCVSIHNYQLTVILVRHLFFKEKKKRILLNTAD